MHKHWYTFDSSEILCKILICINDLLLYICLLVLELNGSHQHSPWSICDKYHFKFIKLQQTEEVYAIFDQVSFKLLLNRFYMNFYSVRGC